MRFKLDLADSMNNTEAKGRLPIITTSFLVMGNVLGVGVLALPIKCGLCGFVPALISIVLIWAVMLISAWVIAYKINLEKSDSFDIPSFYGNALGKAGKWVAITCNLILILLFCFTDWRFHIASDFFLRRHKPQSKRSHAKAQSRKEMQENRD